MDQRSDNAASGRLSSTGPRSSEVERIIATAEVDTTFAGKKARYRGRRATWPGALALILIIGGSIAGLTYYGIQVHKNVRDETPSGLKAKEEFGSGVRITDGRPETVDEDPAVVNPEFYEDRKCEQPNYLSKGGQLVASFKDGSEVALPIKGVSWFGMEDNRGVPKGLWDNSREGSTMYRIGEFLQGNKFNVVRLPLAIDSAMRNIIPFEDLINTASNRALDTTRYIKLLGTVIQGLGRFDIGVVLDFHTLSAFNAEKNYGLWYGESIQMPDIKKAIDNLAEELCNSKHYNLIGIDLWDSPGRKATWGDGTETDWASAASDLANHLLSKCDKWVAFIQGIEGSPRKNTFEDDKEYKTRYWTGSDFTGLQRKRLSVDKSNKVVYAPKFYSNSKYPMPYFFDSGDRDGNLYNDYKESNDQTLEANVLKAMNYMFGLAFETDGAVILSTFGGLLGENDMTKEKTSTRIIEYMIDKMKAANKPLAGGFWSALNHDMLWEFPAPDAQNTTSQGLLDNTWRSAEMDVLNALKAMDKMGVKFIPCKK